MGRDTGFIALACAVAGGAEFVPVPERPELIEELVMALANASGTKSSSIVIVAEGEQEGGAFDVARRVKERMSDADIRVPVIGHMQRVGAPPVQDRLLAGRLGVDAVDGLLAGTHDAMAGVVNGQVQYIAFDQAIGRKKALDTELFRVLSIMAT